MLKFGFIGLDDVSEVLCINLLKRTNTMAFVSDNSIARMEYVVDHGAVACQVASDVIERADVIVMNFGSYVSLQATLYSVIGSLNPQKLLLDLSCISPQESLEAVEILRPTGAEYADICLLDGYERLEQREAMLLYGGQSNVFLKIQEYLKFMTDNVVRVGDVSSSKTMKACYGLLYAQIQNGVNEMMLLANRSGLVMDGVVEAIRKSPAQNSFLEENAEKIVKGNYKRKIDIKKMHKLVEIAHSHSISKNTPLKGLQHTKDLYDSAIDRRLHNHDVTEVYTIVERASHS